MNSVTLHPLHRLKFGGPMDVLSIADIKLMIALFDQTRTLAFDPNRSEQIDQLIRSGYLRPSGDFFVLTDLGARTAISFKEKN
jgi:hypothetical protein